MAMSKYHVENIINPEIVGPGQWFVMHLLGAEVKSEADLTNYKRTIEIILNGIKCNECHSDAIKYYKNKPIDDYRGVGIFYWSVDFHNYVNMKLGKPIVPRNVAYDWFHRRTEETVCTKKCGETKKKRAVEYHPM